MTYTYDGDGARVMKSSGTLYWGSGPLLESALNGNLQREFVFAGGKRIARRDVSGGAVYYYFADHLGSSDVVTNAAGVIQNESDYYPYGGERVYSSNLGSQNYKFTGKERDAESGLDEFGARYYSGNLGRFMIPDWAEKPTAVPYANLGNPQSLNLYSYVENNPTTLGDPDGHGWWTAFVHSPWDGSNWNSNAEQGGRPSVEAAAKTQAQTTITVSTTKVIGSTTDDLGNRTTVTETTTATFSTAKNHEGEFLGATSQTAVHSGGAAGDVIAQSGQVSISQKEAVQGMGARAFTDAQQSAKPNFAQQFGRAAANDARSHPFRYATYAAEVGLVFTPLPEAYAIYEPVKAAGDAALAGWHLLWELDKK